MTRRPRIELQLSRTDKAIERLSLVLLLVFWALTVFSYASLPDKIPIHFNAAGVADGFGGKGNIFIMPIISSLLFVGLRALNKVPHLFNYPVEITKENALEQYTCTTRLIRYLNLILVIVFGGTMLQTVNEQTMGLGKWFLPVTCVLFFLPVVYFIIHSIKNRDK